MPEPYDFDATKADLLAATKQYRAELIAKATDPAGSVSYRMVAGWIAQLNALVLHAVVPAMGAHFRQHRTEIDALAARLDALEAKQKAWRFCGSWCQGFEAKAGNFTTHDGSLWCATEDTAKRPGTSGSGWVLVAKRGRDGKDARG